MGSRPTFSTIFNSCARLATFFIILINIAAVCYYFIMYYNIPATEPYYCGMRTFTKEYSWN